MTVTAISIALLISLLGTSLELFMIPISCLDMLNKYCELVKEYQVQRGPALRKAVSLLDILSFIALKRTMKFSSDILIKFLISFLFQWTCHWIKRCYVRYFIASCLNRCNRDGLRVCTFLFFLNKLYQTMKFVQASACLVRDAEDKKKHLNSSSFAFVLKSARGLTNRRQASHF